MEIRSCRDYMALYADAKVNCKTCAKYDKEIERCADEAGVIQRYEESPKFKVLDRMMRQNRGVQLRE